MALTRKEKEKQAQDLALEIKKAKGAAVFSFMKLTVADSAKLRRELRKKGGRVQVIKKRVFRRTAEEVGVKADFSQIEGSVAVAWSDEDEIASAKTCFDFLRGKEKEGSKLVAGLLNGEAITRQQVEDLAILPGQDEMRAKLVGQLIAPIRSYVGVLSATLRGLPAVLQAISEKK